MDYYFKLIEMEKNEVSNEYIHGWIDGYINNFEMNKRNITDKYKTGYKDAKDKTNVDCFNNSELL